MFGQLQPTIKLVCLGRRPYYVTFAFQDLNVAECGGFWHRYSVGNFNNRQVLRLFSCHNQLVIATEEQEIISVADIARLISVPETTAALYINILVNNGHISRSQKPPGQHNDQLHLTTEGQSMMRKTLLAFLRN